MLALLVVSTGIWAQGTSEAEAGSSEDRCGSDELAVSTRVDDFISFATTCSPRLEAARERWKAALQRVDQVGVLPDPRLHFGHFIESVETRVGPQKNRLGVTQGVPWPSKLRVRRQVAREAARVAEKAYDAARVQVLFAVKDAYYELYYLARAIATTEDNIALLLHLESVAQANFTVGAPVSGVVKAQVELGRLDDQLKSLSALRSPAVARLNAALGRPASSPVSWPGELIPGTLEVDDEEALASLSDGNPELLALDHEVDRNARVVDLARLSFRPDFAFGLDWVDTGEAINPLLADSGKDPLVAKVSMTVPIWRSKYRAAVRDSEHRREEARQKREGLGFALESRLELVLFKFHDAERKIDLFRDTLVPLAEASLEVAQQGYEAGNESFLDVIDAQRQLLELQLALERSRVDREQRLAEIEMLAGRPLASRPAQGDQP
ncbi:MAG: TolC family protein [Acidobacteria bacterium]|nr:MAG: TolC family protein [Acidobacteriota bacterium]REK04453.1 MAG: TolC family protein [Acidobacteriota bacterium]